MTSSDKLFAHTSPGKIFLLAAIPGAVSMLASSLYQTLDGMFVGQGLGSTAFAAINLAMPFVIINFAVADLIGVGSSVPISISLGQGRRDDADQIFSSSVLMIIAASTVLGALMFLLAPALMTLMGAEGDFHRLATQYLRVYAAFSPVTTLVFATDNYMRICGKTQSSMWLNIFMSCCSATLEFLFIIVLGGGVWAAALGTCLSMAISLAIAIMPFILGRRNLRFVRPRITLAMVRRILANGTPNFLNNIAGRLTSIVMNMMLVRMGGQDAVSVYGTLMYADGLVQPVMYGMVDSLQPAIGYNWGAGKKSRVRAIEKCAIAAAVSVCAISFLVIHGIPELVVRIFVDESQTAEAALRGGDKHLDGLHLPPRTALPPPGLRSGRHLVQLRGKQHPRRDPLPPDRRQSLEGDQREGPFLTKRPLSRMAPRSQKTRKASRLTTTMLAPTGVPARQLIVKPRTKQTTDWMALTRVTAL